MLEGFRGLFSRKREGEYSNKNEKLYFSGNSESRKSDDHDENEDSFICDHDRKFYAVLDGISGEEGGKLASDAAKQALEEEFASMPAELVMEDAVFKVNEAIQKAHNRVRQISLETQDHPPGTTLTAIKFFRDPKSKTKDVYAVVGNVGDSRLYQLMNDGNFRRITRDHNVDYYEELKTAGQPQAPRMATILSRESLGVQDKLDDWDGRTLEMNGKNIAFDVKRRNIVSSALGGKTERPNFVDITVVKDIKPGDKFFLTSDGIHDNLTNDEMREAIESVDNPDFAIKSLISAAYERSLEPRKDGGNFRAKPDDMTAVFVGVDAFEEALKKAA